MSNWLDVLSEQARAQGLAKRSALFAAVIPITLLAFVVFAGDGDVGTYVVPLLVATVAGIAVHLVFRWLERR